MSAGDAGDPAAGVASPCVSVCVMDDALGLCVGCFRTLDEIASWSRLDDERRRAVIALLPARAQRAFAESPYANGTLACGGRRGGA